jgi:CheY-like chemotaxis protein
MQGGSIGLSSVFKKGSTFSFYIKARRSTSARARRPSILSNSPEDIRHRVSTRKEIHQLHNLTPSPVSTTSSPTFSRTRPRSQEQAIHDSPTKKKGSGGLDTPRMPSIVRRQSALNSDVPSEAIGLPRDPDLLELTKSRSIPDTLHVLVVEDNLVNQKVLAQQLRKLGCIVSVANHGVEAIDFLPKTKYWSSNAQQHIGATEPPNFSHSPPSSNENDLPVDLSVILMDWEMPRMNGLTATTRIRDLEREGWLTGRIPVIGVTANVRQQQIRQAMEAGMDDVVSKPFRVAELMGRMRGIVQGMGGAHQADGKVGDDGRGRERSGSILGDGGGRDRSGSGYFNSRLERHEPGG